MRQDRFTTKFQEALADAQSLALRHDHQFLEPLHVMLTLLDQQGGTVLPLLMRAGVDGNYLHAQLNNALKQLPQIQGTPGEIHLSQELARLLNITDKLAHQRQDQYISSELFLLAAVEDKGQLGELLRKIRSVRRI